MYCPTCASPLPVGAMFCGECGRAVSSADLAAGRRRAAAAAEHVDAATPADLPEPAPRATTHPRRGDGAEPPWWVRDRQAEAAPVPTPDETGRATPENDRSAVDGPAPVPPASAPEPPAWPVQAPTGVAEPTSDAPETLVPETVAPEEARLESTGASRPMSPPAPPATGAPAPLRSPARHSENGPRPTSAPLWTASLTPIEAEARPSPATADDRAPGSPTVEPEASDEQARRQTGTETEGGAPSGTGIESGPEIETGSGESSEVVETGVEGGHDPSEDRGDVGRVGEDADPDDDERDVPTAGPPQLVHPPTDLPQDGDTAPVAALDPDVPRPSPVGGVGDPVERPVPAEPARSTPVPLVEPAPLVEPGAVFVPERCTQCGASIGEDDIFCGECGAVVQSVALSFTGPIVPLPPGWRPDEGSSVRRRGPVDDAAHEGTGPHDRTGSRVEPGTSRRSPQPDPGAREQAAGDRGTGDDLTGVSPTADDHAADDHAADDHAADGFVSGDPGGRRDADERATARPAPDPVDHVPGFRAERPAVTPRATVADVPPAPSSSSAPAWRPRRPLVDLPSDDDVDETRIVRRAALGSEFVLQFSTGESITIDGTGLVGRAPSPQPGERFDQLVRIVDPGKSVSKTHLEFGQEGGALWISDRWSGNGTVVRPRDLPPRRADPGVRVRVTRGTRVEIGEQFFVVV